MFLNIDKHDKQKLAVKDDSGNTLTYGDICNVIEDFRAFNIPRSVVFCLCENSVGSLIGYIALENNGQVPLLLSVKLDKELRSNLHNIYSPSYYWLPEFLLGEIQGEIVYSCYGYALVKMNTETYSINDKLSLLLTTSGSTGSPKLVRHKYGNLESNAKNVAKAFKWTENEVGICDLPMNYTMGLNVINSHLITGASILMIKANLMNPNFWQFIKDNNGTNFTGVPFSYEVMRRIGFDRMEFPTLHTLAEGGGKLTDKMFKWIASYCESSGKRFVATYGTTETSARIAYLDSKYALNKIGSIGKSIDGGEIFLIDESTDEEGFSIGELAYKGPNVTMGYANSKEDLLKDDEFCEVYATGDFVKKDSEGFYFITGRKNRFLKLFGLRVSLDETEQLLKEKYPKADFACFGDDKKMIIVTTDESIKEELIPFVSNKTNVHNSAFKVCIVKKLPRNSYGKIVYNELIQMISEL